MTSPPATDPAQRLRLFRPAGRTARLWLPTMLACGVAYAVSSQFGGRPLYGNPIEAHR